MTVIHVVGVGLEGRASLTPDCLDLIHQAALLVGSARHLSYFPQVGAEVCSLDNLQTGLDRLKQWVANSSPGFAVVLASGDPLFFGLGRLLVETLPSESLTFHPHLSSIQLAFSRLKMPWQSATVVSVHGRSLDALIPPLRRGDSPIAVLTDPRHTPAQVAQMLLSLNLPQSYRLWVCENLGSPQEQIHQLSLQEATVRSFAPLNVVVLQKIKPWPAPTELPLFGLPDASFATFDDRPGLMTKRDIRLQVLGDLALQPEQVVWDIGAGTGSVSVEVSRLCPDAQIFAIEKTAAGIRLIETNRNRLGNSNLQAIHGTAPAALTPLPDPHRVFIGGSGGQLGPVLEVCRHRLVAGGRIVLALATLEHLAMVMDWVQQQNGLHASPRWEAQYRQVQVQHSVQVGPLTRWQPLTPITVITLVQAKGQAGKLPT